MNKTLVGILLGLLVGAGATWLLLRHPDSAGAAKAGAPAEKPVEKENPLRLSPAKRTAAGIVLAKPVETTLAPEAPLFGRVLDVTPLVTLVGELETARAAGIASEKELDRVKKLFAAGANASAQMVETAEAAAARDRAAIASARSRLTATWGRDVAANLETLSRALDEGASLARLDLLPGEPIGDKPKVARVGLVGTSATFDAAVIGVAPVADPQMQGVSFLALVRGHSLSVGAALRGTLPGAGEDTQALVVPRNAIVYHQGSAWVFVLGEEDTFERKLVSVGRSVGDAGAAVLQGLDAGELVVTDGAQQLLAAELQAGGAPEPE